MGRLLRGIARLLGGLGAVFLGLFGIFRRREPLDPEQRHIDEMTMETRRQVRDHLDPWRRR
ncbi:MAG: hypothetical protein M0R75_06125 [Dehalococcoidia bacterium]|nr:hypothetical protein [Dehalococcoidia bacterium]